MSARSRRGKRGLWAVALSVAAVGIGAVALAAASGQLGFGGSQPQVSSTFPHELTCHEGTDACTPGRSSGGQAFRLLEVVGSARKASVVGVGADSGGDGPATVRICTRSGDVIVCGPQPAAGEKRFAVYVRG